MARLLPLLLVLAACNERASPPPRFDASRQRRVFEPPPGDVRPVPPHAIRANGVGPYLLGSPLNEILGLLPHGPRVELMEIDRVVDYSLVKTEADTIIIGVKRTGVSFVTILDPEIAKTENGVGVGATVVELEKALGSERQAPNQLRDDRLKIFDSLPSAKFVVDHDRVTAVVVGHHDRQRTEEVQPDDGDEVEEEGTEEHPDEIVASEHQPSVCNVEPLVANQEEVVQASRIDNSSTAAQVTYGCLGTGISAALVVADKRLVMVAGEPGKFRRIAIQSVADLIFAGFIDINEDGRHEVGIVADEAAAELRSVRVEIHRMEGGRLVRVASKKVFEVTAASAAWIGARLDQIDLLIEISGRSDTVYIGGLYLHRGKRRPQVVVPLASQKLEVRAKKVMPPPQAEVDAGAAPTRPRPLRNKRDGGVGPRADQPVRPKSTGWGQGGKKGDGR